MCPYIAIDPIISGCVYKFINIQRHVYVMHSSKDFPKSIASLHQWKPYVNIIQHIPIKLQCPGCFILLAFVKRVWII